MAREWRGYYSHDAELLAAYDEDLKRMRNALAAVKRQNRAIRHILRNAATRVDGETVLH